ncbi:MAG: hypothetical protein BZY88_00535 [SAR202 cluster bacterium Io17-Chloro-G9]|nr:MAG: hypothetical protein BZY88_00535 [SAR202 cluster bacterium Io17-Chloro-G9]
MGSSQNELADRIQMRVQRLPKGLQDHIYRVMDIARELAQKHGIDPERASLGMLAHDVARAMSNDELTHRATELGLPIGVVEKRVPVLLHGPVGAEILHREDGLTDDVLYLAVYWHSTGHPSLDTLGKLVFLADKLDPRKISYYPYIPLLRELALENLDRALLEFLTRETMARISKGDLVHPASYETLNSLVAASKAVESEPEC